jgi:hypothetical protein
MVATITISWVVMGVRDKKKNAKKKSAAIVGPSSMTPNESVRYELMAQRLMAKSSPAMRLRTLGSA